MKAFLIFILTVQHTAIHFSVQQYANIYGSESHSQMGSYDYHDHEHDYPAGYYRRSNRRHKKYGSSGGRLPRYNDYDDSSNSCECECQVCDPRPCCKPVCSCEPEPPPEPDTETNQNYGSTNVVFVPYPFPLVVPGSQLSLPTPTQPRTTADPTNTTASITTTTPKPDPDPTKSSLRELLELIHRNPNLKLGSNRDNLVRPMKSTALPKYGIVPLSDHLLKSIISQVRNVKDLQSYS